MRAVPRLLYLLCFAGLAVVAVLALNRVVEPSMANTLLRAAVVAALCGAPGLIHRRLWPLSLVLLPAGAYLLLRTITPIPALVEGVGEQYHFYVEQLRLGADAYLSQVFPLNSIAVPELEVLLAFSTYWLIGAAAFISLGLRKPMPGAVLILILLGFSLTVDGTPRILWSALLFLLLAACLLVLSRSLDRTDWTLRDTLAGGAVGLVASLLALLLLVTVPSAVATPWQDWRAWEPFGRGGSTYSGDWLELFPGLLSAPDDKVAMKVESPAPSYWRANALERFDGSRWTTDLGFLDLPRPAQDGVSYVYSVPDVSPVPLGKEVTQSYVVEDIQTVYLFLGGDPVSLEIDQNLILHTNDARVIHSSKYLGPTLTYSVTAVIPDLEPVDLVDKGSDYPEGLEPYLALPEDEIRDGSEWENLDSLNQTMIGEATDPYHITVNIEKYLRRFFEYSLAPPRSGYSSPYAAFLFDHRSGFCQYFAGAMALLLRYNGIPARVAVGFATGEEEKRGTGVYTVRYNNAHAWTEVYFPEVGWVAFDPTPGTDIEPTLDTDPASPGFINPFIENDLGGPGAPPPEIPRESLPESQPIPDGTAGTGNESWLAQATWLPWVLGVVILLIAWPLGRSLWRRRRLRRGTTEERLQASLALLRREMADSGIAVKPSHTLEEALSVLDSVLHIEPDPRLIARAEAVLFGGYRAREADLDQTETLRRTATARLRRRQGWVRTWLTWYGVPRLSSLRRQEA